MKKTIQPYLIIGACGILAFAPVSLMIQSLKNDIVALEYPISHFISQCIRNGEFPAWFNTWGMGFPLESSLTWGVFSTPRILFSLLFDYNIYALHVEFVFYILLSGWGMFYLLKTHLCQDEKMGLLFSLCYMLSGFMVGSSQWLLYITTAAFVPLIIASLLKLLHNPCLRNSLQFAICYLLMFTSVYAAFTIITTYIIIAIALTGLWNNPNIRYKRLKYLLITALLTFMLCLPCLYYTLELLNNLERGNRLETGSAFFNSNYLHPGALSSMLFPLSSVNMGYSNTEGTMLHTYAGLLTLILLPAATGQMIQTKNRRAGLFLFLSLFFLFVSFGNLTPLRQLLNLLPGFSYFRNPAIFRFFFLFSIIIFLAASLGKYSMEEVFEKKIVRRSIWIAAVVSLIVIIVKLPAAVGLLSNSIYDIIKKITFSKSLLISALIQFILLAFLLHCVYRKKRQLVMWLFAADVVINTLICTPFYSVSSITPAQVNRILKTVEGFPVQTTAPSEVPTTQADYKNNTWQNGHIFRKEVSSQNAYLGPLVLKKFVTNENIDYYKNKQLVFILEDSVLGKVDIVLQRPGHVRALLNMKSPGTIVLLQNYYKGWKAYINNQETDIIKKQRPGMAVRVEAGISTVDFRYMKPFLWVSALLVHLVVILFAVFRLIGLLRRFRFFSLS